jgi:predicted TIM-barrel fold metal-dependent hydrolase
VARTYEIISADGHLEIPSDPWVKYVPERYKDRAPRLVKMPEGGESWAVEGQPLISSAPLIIGGRPRDASGPVSYWNEDGSMTAGSGDARQRLREQDKDGIDAEVLFPPLFVTSAIQSIADPKVYKAIVRAYNTFLAQDYCSVARDRLIGCGVIPTSGLADAIEELKFCKEAGLRAVALNEFPSGGKIPTPEDDAFWETALELGMPLTGHICFGTRFPPFITHGYAAQKDPITVAAGALTSRQVGFAPMYTVAQLIVAGVFDRFPALSFYFAETNASWLAGALWQFDDNLQSSSRLGRDLKLQKKPTEYFKDHIYCSFICDPVALRIIDQLPAGNLMFGTDFPHSVTPYPNSRRWVDENFGPLDRGLRRKILVETPARFFKLDADGPITATPN